MELHRTDEERLDSLKKWWSENGRMLIIGVVVGLGGVSGWTFWQDYERRQSESASALFQAASEAAAAADHAALREAGDTLLSDHNGLGYAAAAALLLAKSEFDQGETEAAKSHYRWVIDHAELPELRDVARLRLAETTYAAGAFDDAMAVLDETPSGPFAAANDHLRGDIHYARGEPGKAREAWERAAAGYTDSPVSQQRLALKLNDLGHLNTPVQP